MPRLTRRTFLAVSTAGAAACALPPAPRVVKERRILTLDYDKSLGMMRAVERVVR